MEFKPASIESIDDGALIERFNFELENVFKDIRDENKDPTKPREITIKVKIKADDERKYPIIEGVVSTKLQPDRPIVVMAHMDHNDVVVSTAEQLDLGIDKEVPLIGKGAEK